jgi:protein-S-isoprenylcysteine O-methyltransferase Ste14
MGEVIGEVLPMALGVAISPVPVIAVILMLLSPHATVSASAFVLGWVVALAVLVGVVALVVGPADDGDASEPSALASWLKVALGAAALVLAVQQWRGRARDGEEPAMPGWMKAIDHLGPGRAVGIGALLAAVNPKNLTLGVSAGVAIGGGGLSGGETAAAVAVFVVLGSVSVGVPVVGYLVAGERAQGPLDELRGWLTANNAAVMTVVLLVLGVTILGKGIGGL